jgi:RimJ/RimL family protein N-acetyltransferase
MVPAEAWRRALRTPRLLLRPMDGEDADAFCALYGDIEVMRRVGAPLDAAAARTAFTRMLAQAVARPPRAHYWMILPHGSQDPVGLIALVHDRGAPEGAECGILLQGPAQACGYATEAIATVALAAFGDFGVTRLWTRHAGANTAVVALMRRLEFTRATDAAGDEVRWHVRPGDPAVAGWRAAGFANPPAGR